MRWFLSGLLGWMIVACAQRPASDERYTPRAMPLPAGLEAASLGYSIIKTLHDPQWLRDPAILGRCSVALNQRSNLEVPCQNVSVAAIDEKGAERGRASVEAGKFRLSVDKGKDYYVKVIAPRYQIPEGKPIGPLRSGETIDLRLSATQP